MDGTVKLEGARLSCQGRYSPRGPVLLPLILFSRSRSERSLPIPPLHPLYFSPTVLLLRWRLALCLPCPRTSTPHHPPFCPLTCPSPSCLVLSSATFASSLLFLPSISELLAPHPLLPPSSPLPSHLALSLPEPTSPSVWHG